MKISFFVFVLLLMSMPISYGLTFKTAILATTASEEFNMFKYNPENPKKPGICIEILNSIEAIDHNIKFTGQELALSVPRIEYELSEGHIDAFCAFLQTPERSQKMKFLNPPIYKVRHKVAVRADDNIKIESFADIRKLGKEGIVIVPANAAHVEYLSLQQGLTLDSSGANIAAGIKMLTGRRGRFLYYSENVLDFYIKQQNLEEKVKILPTVFKEENMHLTASLKMPPKQVANLEKALRKLEDQGKLQKIYSNYFSK